MTAIDATVAPEQFDIGRVIVRTLKVFGRNFPVFLFLAAIGTAPSEFLLWIWMKSLLSGAGGVSMSMAMWSNLPLLIFAYIAFVILVSLAQAAIAYGAIAALNGKSASISDCFSTSLNSLGPLVGIGVLKTLGVALGALLLIVPGINVALMWSVAIPVRVVERTSISDSFSRSEQLTLGHRWAIFGLAVIFVLAGVAAELPVRLFLILSRLPMVHQAIPVLTAVTIYWTAHAVLRTVTTSFGAVGVASIYYELLLIKGVMAPKQVEAVFS